MLDSGTTQIRRVRLPRLADATGNVSYEELVGLVVVFTFPEAGSPDNYTVSLTYYDVDEDMVTIASSDELVDAVEQFSGQKVLRITTYVKAKAASVSSLPVTPQQEFKKQAPVSVDRGTSTRTDPPIPLQNVLESFVGVLSTAVNHLQEGLSAPTSVHDRTSVSPVGASPSSADSGGVNNNEIDEVGATEEAAATPPTEDSPEEEQKEHGSETPEDIPAKAEENGNDVDGQGEERAFIHGRHTCDSCLTTPIIGKRYHSTNLPDYDLCQKCFSNYGGSEIEFESVELERDRAFQSRWHQRQRRSLMMMKRRGCRLGGDRARSFGNIPNNGSELRFAIPPPPPPPASALSSRVLTPPKHGRPRPPLPHYHHHGLPNPPPHHMSPGGFFNHHWSHIGPHVAPHVPHAHLTGDDSGETAFGNALKEAIRRSLNDIPRKEAEVGQTGTVVEPSATSEEAPKEEYSGTEAGGVETNETTIEDETVEQEAADEAISVGIPRSVHIVEQEDINEDLDVADITKTGDVHSFDEIEEASALEKMMDACSVDSEKLLADESESATKTPSKPARKKSDTSKDESFASDAIGNGDVAEAMGAALDKVAGVISEMLSEVDDLKEVFSEVSCAAKSGEIVVDSTEANSGEEEKDDSDWSVVKSVGSTETTESQQIAKAASMLGSALFNSDMKNYEDGSALLDSGSFSVPSSVPTDLGTHISAPAPSQENRWAAQLAQLRELGFNDEKVCVDVLERLEAANIGVDSDEEVSISHVVNELLELQNRM